MRTLLLAALALALAACGGGGASAPAAPPEAAADVELLLRELERIHPNPYHATSREAYRAAADRVIARLPELDDDQLLVELMRLVTMLGERDGHANLQPLNPAHRRPLHLYPLATYGFADGVFVTAAPNQRQLVGLRLVAIEGRPLEEVLDRVNTVVPIDNATTLRSHRGPMLVCAEVLHGLGITPTAARAAFTFENAAGAQTVVELEPMESSAFQRAARASYPLFVDGLPKRPKPLFVSRRGTAQWLTTIDRGRVVYLAYNSTFADTWDTSRRLLRLARRPKTRRVVVDLRNNPGGDISTYPALLEALKSRSINRPGRLVVLIGPTTFSAAVHFATDVDRGTRATFVGEPTGGSPNHYSDTDPVDLPVTGWQVGIPTIYYEKRPGESGLVFEPDVVVPQTAADFFAGRDRELARALSIL